MKNIEIIAINLQLLAETNFNTNTTLDEGLSVENKTFYDKTLIDMASPELVHGQFAQKKPIPRHGGKKIEFRKYSPLAKALTPLTEGVTPNGNKLNVTNIEAEVAQYGDYVTYTDMLDLTAIDNNVVEATKLLGNQAGLTLDTLTRNVMLTTKNVFYCPKGDGTKVESESALDETCELTVDVLKRVAAFLKKNNAPKIDGSYIAIVHPYTAYQLSKDDEWLKPHQYADTENIYNGEIGKIFGVRVIETSEAKVDTNGVFSTLVFGANAYGETEIEGGGLEMIIKQLGSSGVADALNMRASVGWKATHAAEVLVEPYICKVLSKNSLFAEGDAN